MTGARLFITSNPRTTDHTTVCFHDRQLNRSVQCKSCKCIVEEYCSHDISEYYITTHAEELHCVVAPDFLRKHIVDDIPNDPYCTPGFITAFRMLSPQYEPVFGAPARTMSGALAEMERHIGDTLYSGYIGYNGRAPGSSVRRDEQQQVNGERSKSGGDARHILVAYFEIKELASILGVDWQTSTLAIRIFRFTASNTSLRNRSVESLATAAFVASVQRRIRDHEDVAETANNGSSTAEKEEPEWVSRLRNLSVREIAHAANIDESEVHRNLKVVNLALRKQRPDSYESIVAQMPTVCDHLRLEETTRRLAVEIAEKAIQLNICSRRLPASVSAACIYMACQLDGVHRTQIEICRATTVTEVTLRKVYKELTKEEALLVPTWFEVIKKGKERFSVGMDGNQRKLKGVVEDQRARRLSAASTNSQSASQVSQATSQIIDQHMQPPPLPPGFSHPSVPTPPALPARITSSTPKPASPVTNGLSPSCQQSSASHGAATVSMGNEAPSTTIPTPVIPGTTPQGSIPGATPIMPNPAMLDPTVASMMLRMIQSPAAMQAFAQAVAMMPHVMPSMIVPPPPPPPPPLPPRLPERSTTALNGTSAASSSSAMPPTPPAIPASTASGGNKSATAINRNSAASMSSDALGSSNDTKSALAVLPGTVKMKSKQSGVEEPRKQHDNAAQ